jgi:hypothetical protein
MHVLIEQKRCEISDICRHFRVRRLEVFGSAARATDFDPASSDADFLVEFERESMPTLSTYFGLKDALEALLARKIDLVESGAVRNPYFKTSVDRDRELVYEA